MSRSGNLMVVQAGGPTAVVNTTLFGVIRQAGWHDEKIGRVLGARYGLEGLVNNDIVDLCDMPGRTVNELLDTPGAALGSSRILLDDEQFATALHTLRSHAVRYLILIGGNGTMCAARRLHELADDAGDDLVVVGVPKTVDNDIIGTDRCPGYASAARFVAQSVCGLGLDVQTLPVPVSIFESMGRDAGWLAAASVLARTDHANTDQPPHLIYLPEQPFDLDTFLAAVDRTMTRLGYVVAAVSEGLSDAAGRPVYQSAEDAHRDEVGRALPGDVGRFLAAEVGRRLGLRCRSEKPGLCGRSSIAHRSVLDRRDAEHVGRAAVNAAVNDQRGVMIALRPHNPGATAAESTTVPIQHITTAHRTLPPDSLTPDPTTIAQPFIDYLKPLIAPLPLGPRPKPLGPSP